MLSDPSGLEVAAFGLGRMLRDNFNNVQFGGEVSFEAGNNYSPDESARASLPKNRGGQLI